MFTTSILPDAFARAFAELPPESIWEWADRNVWLVSQSAAEPGLYRSAKTPWTRRIQELAREPVVPVWSWQRLEWTWTAVGEYTAMKSSQAGLSEAALNIVRWRAKHDPCNVIYGIDTREEAKNIVDRLIPTLADIDPSIFTGDDDDVGTYVARLRDMIVWFIGSFSTGKFANKQAPLRILDEIEEHGAKGTIREMASRGKTADDGLQINLSKPKYSGGPIHKAYERGNQEHYFFKCPACGHNQWPSFFETAVETVMDYQNLIEVRHPSGTRSVLLPTPYPEGQTRTIRTSQVVFDHCRTPLGEWDRLRMLSEAAIQCASCGHLIDEQAKRALLQRQWWMPTAHGTPGSVSQQISDLYSSDKSSSLGHLSMEYLDAKKEGVDGIAKFYNHRLGLPYTHEVNVTRESDIRANVAGASEGDECPPYKRGTVPFVPSCLLLGGDVGGNYAKWALGAVSQNLNDVAVIDWGEELDPNAVAEIINTKTWPGVDGKPLRIYFGFLDAKFRKTEVYRACLAVPGRRLIPTAGLGGAAARSGKAWSYHQVATYQKTLKELTYNDRDAKDELYVSRLKKRRSRVWFPMDVVGDQEFVQEMCAEELVRDEHGRTRWNEHPGANHYGDCVKDIITGLRFLTRKQQVSTGSAAVDSSGPTTPSAQSIDE